MWKFIRGKGQPPLAERQKLQKELFAYKKVKHYFQIEKFIEYFSIFYANRATCDRPVSKLLVFFFRLE